MTCFETLEHLPDPLDGIAKIVECVAEPGAVFYSTLTQPDDFDKQGVSWWYVGPRNGHISIFTQAGAREGLGPSRLPHRRAQSGHAPRLPDAAEELGPDALQS